MNLLDDSVISALNLEDIIELKICFNFSVMSEIYLNIKKDKAEEKCIIYDTDNINEIMDLNCSSFRGHEIVFDKLVNEQEFNHAEFDEISALWKLFDEINNIKKELFYYEIGTTLPLEAKNLKMKLNNNK